MERTWREQAAHLAGLIYGVLDTWRVEIDCYPSYSRQPWKPLGGWWTGFRKALLADRGFFAGADAHIIQSIEHFDPMAEAASENVRKICERLARIIARLKDGGGGADLVWEELRSDRNLTKLDVFVPNHDDLGPDLIQLAVPPELISESTSSVQKSESKEKETGGQSREEAKINPCDVTLDPIASVLKKVSGNPKDCFGSHRLEMALNRYNVDEFLAWYAGMKSPSDAAMLKKSVTDPILALKNWDADMLRRGWDPKMDLEGSIENRSDQHERHEMRDRYDDILVAISKSARDLGIFSKSLRKKLGANPTQGKIQEVLAIVQSLKLRETIGAESHRLASNATKRRGRPAKDHSALKQWISGRCFIVPNKVNRLLAEIIAAELKEHNPTGVSQVGWSAIERVMRGCKVNWSGEAPRVQAKVSWPQ